MIEQLSAPFVVFALEERALVAHQAIQTFSAYGRARAVGEAFSLRAYWCEQKRWLSPSLYDALWERFSTETSAEQQEEVLDAETQRSRDLDCLATVQLYILQHPTDSQETPQRIQIERGKKQEKQQKAMLQIAKEADHRAKESDSSAKEEVPKTQVLSVSVTEASEDIPAQAHLVEAPQVLWQPARVYAERYKEEEELGRGGLGRVVALYDRNVGRKVASKMLLKGTGASFREHQRFFEEARLTGQLEHPNIIPIYDIGVLEDGQPYYTMRLSSSRNLAQVLEERSASILQLLKILQQMCMGLEYAHSRNVIHRDIKPANILLGEFGEVLILDWGIAERTAPEDQADGFSTQTPKDKIPRGTPAYIAPEVLTKGIISPALDQYALGVILYEILTGKRPFEEVNLFTLIFKVSFEEPYPPSHCDVSWEVPEELEQICLRMLAKDPQARFPSCRAVYDQLEEYLEGTKEKQRRKEAALSRIAEADAIKVEFYEKRAQLGALRKEWEDAQKTVEPWDSPEAKREAWAKEDKFLEFEQEVVRLFGAAVQKYIRALEHEPGNADAKNGLVELYWERFLEAEREGDTLQQIYYRDLVEFYDDGTYARLLHGQGIVEIATDPKDATLQVFRFVEQERRLRPLLEIEEKKTPSTLELSQGSYLLRFHKQGRRDTLYPLQIQRTTRDAVHIRLYREEEIGGAYIHVPAGPFPFGGDPEALMGLPFSHHTLDDFFISRYPVTLGEYLIYVNTIHAEDPARAADLVPRSGQENYAILEGDHYIPHRAALLEGEIAQRYPVGEGHEERLPVFGVSWFEAVLYCRWRTQREGRLVSLPSEEQWEKAAGCFDQRIYPWGNRFDATFCKMGRSRPANQLQPEPIGVFTADQSVYGMCDVVGCVSEWTLSMTPEEVALFTEDPKITPVQRGGGWVASNERSLRLRTRLPRAEGTRTYNCGFRVVAYPKQPS
ncbi:bifunctional serine/threonine-protein kinase/formylglycine-generating enzyme family protein [Myxococcota bacterium]|nr:bifunctional serine/threonine-protein kinase/formylglycine-generating enzyme family protein [Myxococcota bacterium]